jgi:ribosome recycling factor
VSQPAAVHVRWFARKSKKVTRQKQEQKQAPDDAASEDDGEDVPQFRIEEHTNKLTKATEALGRKFNALQLGRAVPALIEDISVMAYEGAGTNPIKQLGTVLVKDPQTLAIQLYDPTVGGAMVRAINASGLDLSPILEQKTVIVPIPRMTKEGRVAVVKNARAMAEQVRLSVREVRKQMNSALKSAAEVHSMPKDEVHSLNGQIQSAIDSVNKTVDDMLKAKEADIMDY